MKITFCAIGLFVLSLTFAAADETYNGQPVGPSLSPDDADGYAPHFVNLALDRSLLKVAQNHPDKTITVLCGHTHHQALYAPTSNLKVQVAGAEYKDPRIASILNYT